MERAGPLAQRLIFEACERSLENENRNLREVLREQELGRLRGRPVKYSRQDGEVRAAIERLRGPLRFGSEEQIAAARFLEGTGLKSLTDEDFLPRKDMRRDESGISYKTAGGSD